MKAWTTCFPARAESPILEVGRFRGAPRLAATERRPTMAVNKLLVAFDESEGADRALAMAASLAA